MELPARFSDASFARYEPQHPGQQEALDEARQFVEDLRALHRWPRLLRWLRPRPRWKGLYLVGPVGTGKTHLLASMYNALHPAVPCAFLHSSALYRLVEHPEALARRLADSYRVLCLDEVEIDDPANEARLVLLFNALAAHGVTLLATSNVEPERFLSATYGNDRFRRFLEEEFRLGYEVIIVGGEDFREHLEKPGRAWIGPSDRTRSLLRAAYEADPHRKKWMTFAALRQATIDVPHTRLIADLEGYETLYLADLDAADTDDALRLLRLIDDLYMAPRPPVLYFTAEADPRAWLAPDALHRTLDRGIAEKFSRTTSRLHALCAFEYLDEDLRKAG